MEIDILDYNQWLSDNKEGDDVTAIWHRFARSKLLSYNLEGKKVLEIGCGRGGFSNYMASVTKESTSIYACDYSETALEIAKGKYSNHNEIQWKKEDIQNLSFQNNFFDIIVSCETIEHVRQPEKALKELYRVLKPGGSLILACPNYFNFFGIWCAYRWLIGKPFDEGGQPYVNYLLLPKIYFCVKNLGFRILCFKSAQIIIPSRVPKIFFMEGTPRWLNILSYRTFYVLGK